MASTFEFEAIGTDWTINILQDTEKARHAELLNLIAARIELFDVAYSRFRADSLVTTMAQYAGTYALPDDAEPLFRLYKNMHQITEGLVTPLIGQLMVDAGYDATYSFVPHELHEPPAWAETMEFVGPHTLIMKEPTLLDFGAFGKGYLVDIIGDLLTEEGIQSFCINAGGDILHRSATHELIRIGLEDPRDTTKVIGVAEIGNKSLCGSAGNRRAWGKFHHVINPKTLESPRDIIATWACADTTLLADAMTTGLYFVSPEQLLKYYSFDYVVLNKDASIKHSPSFPTELFVTN